MKKHHLIKIFYQWDTSYGPAFLILVIFLILEPIWAQICYAQSKPNIIVIIPDDMGWSDVGYNGSAIKTPNIDKLEQSGIRLNYQYVMTTCTPTRVGLFTGQYASRFGVVGPDYGEVIPLGMPTMASLLANKGYFTALVGKWHMGSPPYIPVKYGFQSAYGYFDGQIDPYTHNYKKQATYTSRKSWNGEGTYLHHKHKYLHQHHKTYYIKTKPGEKAHRRSLKGFKYLKQKGHATDLLTDQTVHIIKEKRQRPFFLYLAYSVPHYPLNESQKWLSKYKHTFTYSSRRRFAASITHMDADIGRIIKALNKTGQRGNTLILFISDNGGQKSWPKTERKTQYKGRYVHMPHNVLGNNFPLRGWKTSLYEGGIRVPAFISWPSHLRPESVNIPTKWTDWLPTFLGLIDSSPGDIQKLNLAGKNLWPLLNGTEKEADFKPRTIYWKTPDSYAMRKGPWKMLVHRKTGKAELYNINADFREQHDVSREHPKKIRRLKKLLKKSEKEDKKSGKKLNIN